MELKDALGKLDAGNDEHWTTDGAPRIDAVAAFVDGNVTRSMIVEVAPQFTRSNPTLDVAPEPSPPNVVGAPPQPMTWDEGLARYNELSNQMQVLQAERGEIDTKITKLSRELARLQRFSVADEYNHKSDQKTRMEFIQSQQRQRADRAAAAAQAAPVCAPVQAPIDRAMMRKKARGAVRPTYPAAQTGG